MFDWLNPETLKILITLILGGSGYAALHRFIVRPRVYVASRYERTIPRISEERRKKIEELLRKEGFPTAFCEVEWWNRGRRGAESIHIEVVATSNVLTWEMTPESDSIKAPWSCTKDPKAANSSASLIRIEQPKLMPKAHCRLVIGYDAASSDERPKIHAYEKDSEMSSPGNLTAIHSLLALVGGALLFVAVMTLYSKYESAFWGSVHKFPGYVVGPIVIVTLIGCTFAAAFLLQGLYPGSPTWRK